MAIVASFDVLEPRVIGTIGAPHAALSFPLHDVHVVAVFVHRQFRFQRLSPLSGSPLPIRRLPVGGNVVANSIPAQWKCRSVTGTRVTAP